MKRLYGNILKFLLPVLLGLIFLPVNQRLKYEGLENDCFNHGIWIYDRIHHNEKPVDIAFLGSSRSINGINDRLIEHILKEMEDGQVPEPGVANFGYCRLGRNLSYVLLKEILDGKTPSHIVIEVREDEGRYSHPIFPYMAGTGDALLANPFFNKDLLGDIWTHFAYKVDMTQQSLFDPGSRSSIEKGDFGIATSTDTAEVARLNEARARRSHGRPELSPLGRNFHQAYARSYLRKMNRLCEKHGIGIIFLYLPAYGSGQDMPDEFETYRQFGNLLIPPEEIFEDPANWFDENHFNQGGSDKLSTWLATRLGDIIR